MEEGNKCQHGEQLVAFSSARDLIFMSGGIFQDPLEAKALFMYSLTAHASISLQHVS